MSFWKRNSKRPAARRSIWADRSGAALVYVAVLSTALFGLVAIVIDLSRIEITHTAARSAAEAMALAGASQLDGTSGAIARAENAINSTLLQQNGQIFAQGSGTRITAASIRFLDGLPAGDPTLPDNSAPLDPFVLDKTDPVSDFEARFVEVYAEVLTVDNSFMVAVGAGATTNTSASAVAGFTQVLCKRAPLAICNPMEEPPPVGGPGISPPPLDINNWRGREVLVKASGPSSSWIPGDMSLVDIDGVQSTPEIWQALAEDEPDVCIDSRIDLKPGQAQGMRTALNTRLDMYENPFGKNNNHPKIYPARNITRGQTLDDPNDMCSYRDPNPAMPKKSMYYPPDTQAKASEGGTFSPGGPSNTRRFGNGEWDCLDYVNTMHAGVVPSNFAGGNAAACTSTTDGTVDGQSRFDMYRAEVEQPNIPNTCPAGECENANRMGAAPKCYGGSGTPPGNLDRREVFFAVINCLEHDLGGGNSNGAIPVEAFIKGFLVQPVADPPDGPEIMLEIIDIVRANDSSGVLHDIVQLYR